MSITVVSIEDGGFDKNAENVILTDGYLTIECKGIVWDDPVEEELEEIFNEWILFVKEGEDGYTFV